MRTAVVQPAVGVPGRVDARAAEPCVEATASTRTTCSICCRGWSANPSWWWTARSPTRPVPLLETVRQYARERLVQAGAADRLRERHFEFFFNEFRGVLPILRHHDQLPCLRRLRIEQENVRAALEWALTSSGLAEKGVDSRARCSGSGRSPACTTRARSGSNRRSRFQFTHAGALRARALIGVANLHRFQGRHVEAGVLAGEALALGHDELGKSLESRGLVEAAEDTFLAPDINNPRPLSHTECWPSFMRDVSPLCKGRAAEGGTGRKRSW